ncbi:DUF2850 domain-containing protein [Vibrio sp. WXL103]|uniref:DUF2850 domain-containing protein n=1 Tax=unclassified Vibrio TaxID=2614977 RepID=UPI003EC8BC10
MIDNHKAFRRKYIERSLILLATLSTLVAVALYTDLYGQVQQSKYPKEKLYGRWVELEVARHVRDSFTLSELGVSRSGRVVATDYRFNGRYVEFQVAGETVRFRILNQEDTEMIMESDALYNPTYRNIEQYNQELR